MCTGTTASNAMLGNVFILRSAALSIFNILTEDISIAFDASILSLQSFKSLLSELLY